VEEATRLLKITDRLKSMGPAGTTTGKSKRAAR
jgi:hypothetical protein